MQSPAAATDPGNAGPWSPGAQSGKPARTMLGGGPSPPAGSMKVLNRGFFETVVKPSSTVTRTPASSEAHSPIGTAATSINSKASTPTGRTMRRSKSLGVGDQSTSGASSTSPTQDQRRRSTLGQDPGSPDTARAPQARYRLLSSKSFSSNQEEKKYADLYSKLEKNEASRDAGDKAIRERNASM